MQYRNLGPAGVKISPLCLGTMMLGSWGNPNHAECVRIIHKALDQGINFIDTANMYSDGEAERILGKALKGRREQAVLATKVYWPVADGNSGPNRSGLSRKAIQEQLEASLRRLVTDVIDLYLIPPTGSHRALGGNALDARRPGSPGQDPLHRLLHQPLPGR